MGGLIVREAIQRAIRSGRRRPPTTSTRSSRSALRTRGSRFSSSRSGSSIDAGGRARSTSIPSSRTTRTNQPSYVHFGEYFPPKRLLTVVGTNYRTYGVGGVVGAQSPVLGVRRGRAELQPQRRAREADVRADPGLAAHVRAQVPRRPRLAGHGARVVRDRDAASSSGTCCARLSLIDAEVKRGFDLFGKSEFFFGVSIKPRAGRLRPLPPERRGREHATAPFHSKT